MAQFLPPPLPGVPPAPPPRRRRRLRAALVLGIGLVTAVALVAGVLGALIVVRFAYDESP